MHACMLGSVHTEDLPVTLPPGQRAIDGFPRFGTHLHRSPPAVPIDPVIEICGAVAKSFSLPLAELAALPRRHLTADFHCVAGWSATSLRWEGVAFATFYRLIIEPSVQPDLSVTHIVFGGLDGYRSVVSIEDALADDVLIAERLDGTEPPAAERGENSGHAPRISQVLMVPPLFKRHPRSRVWEEERNGSLPAWLVRPVYRLLIPPIGFLGARGSRRSSD